MYNGKNICTPERRDILYEIVKTRCVCLQKLSLFDGICKKRARESPKIDLPAVLNGTRSAAFEPISKTPAFW